jgi:hypothetical protein
MCKRWDTPEWETSVGLVIPQMGDKRKPRAWGGEALPWGTDRAAEDTEAEA